MKVIVKHAGNPLCLFLACLLMVSQLFMGAGIAAATTSDAEVSHANDALQGEEQTLASQVDISEIDSSGSLLSDMSGSVITDQVGLYVKDSGGFWVPWTAGTTLHPGNAVRYEVFWHLPAKVTDGDTISIPFTGTGLTFPDSVTRNLYDEGDANLILGTWYVQNGVIHCTFNAAAAEKDSIDDGMFYLEATIDGSGEGISVTVGGAATVPAPVTPGDPIELNPLGPAPAVSKVGYVQIGGKLDWSLSVNVDLEQELFRNITNGSSMPTPSARPNLLLIDELENGQRISSPDDIGLITNIHIPTQAGEVSTYDNWMNVKDQFVWINGKDTMTYPTETAFLAALKADPDQPAYGVYVNAAGNDVVYVFFGTVPSSTSKLNTKNLSFQGYPGTDAAIQAWIDAYDSSLSFNALQRTILEESLLSTGSNKGALTAFTVIIAPDPGSLQNGATYENTGKMIWDGNESQSGTPKVTYYDEGGSAGGRVTGTLELTKTDESGQPLAGAEFALYRENSAGEKEWFISSKDSSGAWEWSSDRRNAASLKSDSAGKIAVAGLKKGTYWMTETAAPAGFELDSTPVKFSVVGGASKPASATVVNKPAPPEPDTPAPITPAAPSESDIPDQAKALAATGDASVGFVCFFAVLVCVAALCAVGVKRIRRASQP